MKKKWLKIRFVKRQFTRSYLNERSLVITITGWGTRGEQAVKTFLPFIG